MISLTVLASGSQANCSALVVGERLVLVDAGLSPRATRERLFSATGRMPETATDLVLTHLDADHYREGWSRVVARHGMRVRIHRAHLREALAAGIPEPALLPFDDVCDLGDGLVATAHRTPHDDRGSSAFAFECTRDDGVARLGYATDLGRVPEGLFERFTDLDILAIESNYDFAMQLASDRPGFLKQRIMGGRGHLSNEQALAAALRISRAGHVGAIVLLHLSRQCNCPDLVARLWRDRAPHLADRVVTSSQHAPTRTVVAPIRAPRPRFVDAMLFA